MKKLNKLFAVLVALAMMATLCVSMAFAVGDTDPAGDLAKDASAAKLVKYLQAGKGVTKPDASYNFTVTSTTPGAAAATNTTITKDAMQKDANDDYIGELTIAKMFENAEWTKPGEFVYTVKETAATRVATGETWVDGANEKLTLDQDEYTLRVYVKYSGDNLVIDKVTVSDGEEKVDPTEKKETADEGQNQDGSQVGFSVTNNYENNLVKPDDDANGVLNVSKTVVGDYADKTYEFSFDLTYAIPENNTTGKVRYRIDKMNEEGTLVTGEAKDATSSPIHADLKHGEKLVIVQMPQGTSWSTKENLTAATDLQNRANYLPSVDKYAKYAENKTAFDKGADAETSAQYLAAPDAVAYTNTLDNNDTTPTGILINNLPYIALALVAIGGLVAYVVVRRRQSDEA